MWVVEERLTKHSPLLRSFCINATIVLVLLAVMIERGFSSSNVGTDALSLSLLDFKGLFPPEDGSFWFCGLSESGRFRRVLVWTRSSPIIFKKVPDMKQQNEAVSNEQHYSELEKKSKPVTIGRP